MLMENAHFIVFVEKGHFILTIHNNINFLRTMLVPKSIVWGHLVPIFYRKSIVQFIPSDFNFRIYLLADSVSIDVSLFILNHSLVYMFISLFIINHSLVYRFISLYSIIHLICTHPKKTININVFRLRFLLIKSAHSIVLVGNARATWRINVQLMWMESTRFIGFCKNCISMEVMWMKSVLFICTCGKFPIHIYYQHLVYVNGKYTFHCTRGKRPLYIYYQY